MCFLFISISGGPHYISSLSYLADSSLSEEMSQFDFSTGVQSYSYQDPKSTTGPFRRRVITFYMLKNIISICKGRGLPCYRESHFSVSSLQRTVLVWRIFQDPSPSLRKRNEE